MTEPDMELYEDLLNLRNIPALDRFVAQYEGKFIFTADGTPYHQWKKTIQPPPLDEDTTDTAAEEKKPTKRQRQREKKRAASERTAVANANAPSHASASFAPTISDEVSAGIDAAAPGPLRSASTVDSATPPPASPTPSYSEVLQRPGSAMSYASDASHPRIEESADTDCEDGFTIMVGKDWLYGLLNRHRNISLRDPEKTYIVRAKGLNRTAASKFYDLSNYVYGKHNLSPNDIYNADETGVLTVPNKQSKVLALRGKNKWAACLRLKEEFLLLLKPA
ncbi:hypothetical protein ILUMI_18265 [Ignelater luminosus]|uniref:Uncharacterized protein n=1 Tax=Ignelater luminosus TaxID=2038154 RepID=A0A8K0G4A1_IGNLU|nr:hypothetical protein ILUMI_18265 [Ignelater luminosus]